MCALSVRGNAKRVANEKDWSQVVQELQKENLKLMSYDHALLAELGNVCGRSVLDYGAGPGVLALTLTKLGAIVKVFDVSAEMRQKAAHNIGRRNVYDSVVKIPQGEFDIVVCNLVVCIVSESEVRRIARNISKLLRAGGQAYVGFCNPKIHNVAESRLDFRYFSGKPYGQNHNYWKVKKEGFYQIVERHRPISWYAKAFAQSGLKVGKLIFTPKYRLRGRQIQDFVIFSLQKNTP